MRPSDPAAKQLSLARGHGQGLEAVKDKLSELIVSLRVQRERLDGYARAASAPDVRPGPAPDSSSEARALAAELALAREALAYHADLEQRLRERLSEIERDYRRLCDEWASVQEQNSELVGLYVAVERLHGASDRAQVFATIREIVVDLLGSEEMAVFETTPDRRWLVPSHTFGFGQRAPEPVEVGSGPIGHAFAARRLCLPEEEGIAVSPNERCPTACIPLEAEGEVVGALAVYGLLAHKAGLTRFDRDLLAALSKHAGAALRRTSGVASAATSPSAPAVHPAHGKDPS